MKSGSDRTPAVAGTVAVLVVAAVWHFAGGRPREGRSPEALAGAGGPTASEPQTWQGRAFCPDCAPPRIGGRVPAHGIFVHVENGREVIYELTLPLPLPDFHTRLCLPSMNDVHAVEVRGTPGTRDGRLALTVTTLAPRLR